MVYFGRHSVNESLCGLSAASVLDGVVEIDNFDEVVVDSADEDIFEAEIPVHDAFGVDLMDAGTDLREKVFNLFFGEVVFAGVCLESGASVFHEQVNGSGVLEMPEKLDDIGVVYEIEGENLVVDGVVLDGVFGRGVVDATFEDDFHGVFGFVELEGQYWVGGIGLVDADELDIAVFALLVDLLFNNDVLDFEVFESLVFDWDVIDAVLHLESNWS